MRTRILIVIMAFLSLSLTYTWLITPQQKSIKRGEHSKRHFATAKAGTPDGIVPLDFAGCRDLSFHPPLRDLFRPLCNVSTKNDCVEDEMVPAEAVPVAESPLPQILEPSTPPDMDSRPEEYAITQSIPMLKVVGFLRKGPMTVFLASDNGALFLVKEGEAFGQDLVVAKLDPDVVVIRNLRDDSEKILTLENE